MYQNKKQGSNLNSIHKLKLEEKINLLITSLKANEKDIEKIYELFENYKKNQSLEQIKEKYEDLYLPKVFKKFSKNYPFFDKHYIELTDLNNNDVNLIKEYLLKLVLKYFLFEIDENKKSKVEIELLKEELPKMRLKLIDNITKIIKDLDNSTQEIILKSDYIEQQCLIYTQ